MTDLGTLVQIAYVTDAIGEWGELQIALIAERSDADSAHAVGQGRGDVDHLALEVADLSVARDEAQRLGFAIVQRRFGAGGIEIVCIGNRALGHNNELLPLTPFRQAFYGGPHEAHRNCEQPMIRRVSCRAPAAIDIHNCI